MHDRRRRAASLIVLAAAGLAAAGTSAIPPSPGPTQLVALAGTVHMTADHPVAIQPIDIDVRDGRLMTVEFSATLSQVPSEGRLIATIVPGDNGTARDVAGTPPDPSARPDIHAAFNYGGCPNPCPGAYQLVITWVGAPDGGVADVAWSMDAIARYPDVYPGGTPQPGAAVISAPSTEVLTPKTANLASTTSGKAVHLTETDRVRAWTARLHRSTSDVDPKSHNRLSWVGQARLELTATQTAGGGFGDGTDPREMYRSDPPIFLQVVGDGVVQSLRTPATTWAGQRPIVFDPFAACAEGECDAAFTVEAIWRDGRPDTAFDASWALDFASVGGKFTGSLDEVEVKAVEAPQLATASASGSFEIASPQLSGQSSFVTEMPAFDASSVGVWADLGIPTRGRMTARVSLLSGTAPPPDAAFLITASDSGHGNAGALGGLPTQLALRVGEEGAVAFEPVVHCQSVGTNECRIDGTISARRGPSNQIKFPADLRIRVDWTLELAAPGAPGKLQLVVNPTPSARP
jgi:hypothetical protein